MKLTVLGTRLLLVVGLASCAEEGAAPTPGGELMLALDGKLELAPDVSSEAVLIWDINDGDPDYTYLWGRANIRDAVFSLQLTTRPPAEALTKYGLGVARLLTLPKSAKAPEGKLQHDAAFRHDISGASRFALVYVDHDMAKAALNSTANPLTEQEREAALDHWLYDFPPGYSCAEGRAAGPDEIFDSLVPVSCAQLEISAGTDVPFPNWT